MLGEAVVPRCEWFWIHMFPAAVVTGVRVRRVIGGVAERLGWRLWSLGILRARLAFRHPVRRVTVVPIHRDHDAQ